MKVVILDEAERDLIEGHGFYEEQGEGLGHYFLDSLFADIDSLLIYPGIHPIYFGRYHRALARRFPFGVYYTLADQVIRVHAVIDLRRKPAWIRKRMKLRRE